MLDLNPWILYVSRHGAFISSVRINPPHGGLEETKGGREQGWMGERPTAFHKTSVTKAGLPTENWQLFLVRLSVDISSDTNLYSYRAWCGDMIQVYLH